MSRLRRKMGSEDADGIIKTIRGAGIHVRADCHQALMARTPA